MTKVIPFMAKVNVLYLCAKWAQIYAQSEPLASLFGSVLKPCIYSFWIQVNLVGGRDEKHQRWGIQRTLDHRPEEYNLYETNQSANHLLTHSDPSCWYSSMWACVKTSNRGHLVLTSHYIVDAYGFSSPNREFFCLGSWSTCGCLITWTSEHTWTTNATSPSLHPHRVHLHVEITGKAHTYRKSGFPSPPPKTKEKTTTHDPNQPFYQQTSGAPQPVDLILGLLHCIVKQQRLGMGGPPRHLTEVQRNGTYVAHLTVVDLPTLFLWF